MANGSVALWLAPEPRLSGGIVGAIWRDTRAASLADSRRFNHFPASPMCTVTWLFEGASVMLQPDIGSLQQAERLTLDGLIVSGAQAGPTSSWNPGRVCALMVAFYPEALRPLLSVPPRTLKDRSVPARQVLEPEWFGRFSRLLEMPAGELAPQRCFDRVQALLSDPALMPEAFGRRPRIEDWLAHLLDRAVHSSVGRGVRQLQRRMADWTGQNRRELEGFARAERLFLEVMSKGPAFDAATLAADAGFADQAHMIRRVKSVTGLPPHKLHKHILEDDGYWPYAVIGMHLQRLSNRDAGRPDPEERP
jgi:AraC-like DNA-binding protein